MIGELRRGDTVVIATHNQGKARELAELFAPIGIDTVSAGALGLPEPEETGASFAENAKIKAVAASTASGMLAVADDSGLEVAALGGAPGIHSARWSGPTRDFRLAMERVNRELEASGSTDRSARFVCALALGQPSGVTMVRIGKINGTIVWPPRGDRGFGYDPIFVPDGYTETFGEMDPVFKNDMSHRMRAFEKLIRSTWPYDED
ncbi:MAG TPA: RdgB/HAM1 family non-canonical purine NTP pyrophosphatase [Methyloceanibacter sp.]|jgi:XTP/dITP diphosphohydrolase|nr:RdgB/HAM1 family non-canonical purine NTP pyrophosphatase [Methyloceanibacter sp.]